MTSLSAGHRGVLVYAAVALSCVTAVSGLMHAMNLSVSGGPGGALALAIMWIPALARLVATHTVDRGWTPPFPLHRWGHPRPAPVVLPIVIVSAIYVGAYLLAWLLDVPRQAPVWQGAAVPINLVVNVPLLAAIGLVGSLGEEIGWRGYLQPRLDQLAVPASLLWVILLETLFHIPVIVLAGYLAAGSAAVTIALFFGLNLGAKPVWTWATYRWRTIWMAASFHTVHNAVSQVLVPKTLGAGSPLVLGESGVLPVALYLMAAGALCAVLRARGQRWSDVSQRALGLGRTGQQTGRSLGRP